MAKLTCLDRLEWTILLGKISEIPGLSKADPFSFVSAKVQECGTCILVEANWEDEQTNKQSCKCTIALSYNYLNTFE
jgi:hypothetical protein